MQDIKDKIAKLLALAGNNSSEGEAKAALLKARALMAEHKLRPEECQKAEDAKVIQSLCGVACTALKHSWGIELAAIIAKHYCCIAYRQHKKGKRTNEIGFVGLEDDFEICIRIFRYAFDCVKKTSDEIFNEDADFFSPSYRRRNAEAYGWAFCQGLSDAFEAQQEEHQEWGLVMVVPQEVQNTKIGKTKATSFGKDKSTEDNIDARRRGYEDGLKFDPASKLAEAKAPMALCG